MNTNKKEYNRGRFENFEEFKLFLAREILKGFGRMLEMHDFITYRTLLEIVRAWDKLEEDKYPL